MDYWTRQELQELLNKFIDTNLYGKSVKFSDNHIFYPGETAEIVGYQINFFRKDDEAPSYIVRFPSGECFGVPFDLRYWHYFGVTLVD